MITNIKEVSQIILRLRLGRAGLRWKIRTTVTKPIMQTAEKSLKIHDIMKT